MFWEIKYVLSRQWRLWSKSSMKQSRWLVSNSTQGQHKFIWKSFSLQNVEFLQLYFLQCKHRCFIAFLSFHHYSIQKIISIKILFRGTEPWSIFVKVQDVSASTVEASSTELLACCSAVHWQLNEMSRSSRTVAEMPPQLRPSVRRFLQKWPRVGSPDTEF